MQVLCMGGKFSSSCSTSSLSPGHGMRRRKTTGSCMVAPPHVQGHWGQPDGLTASRSTLHPELEQLKCQAELGWAKLLPSGEWAHVHAAWAARAPGLSDVCASTRRLHAQLPRLSAAHKPPAAVWPWPFSGDPGNLQPEEGSA